MANNFVGKLRKALLGIVVMAFAMITGTTAVQAATEVTGGASKETAAQIRVASDISETSVEAAKVLTKLDGDCWYKFTTSANDSFYRIYVKNISVESTNYGQKGFTTVLTSEAGEELWDANQVRMNNEVVGYVDLTPNTTYYLQCFPAVKGGNVYLSVAESKDDAKDTEAEALQIALNKEYIYGFQSSADSDWFKFTTTGNNSYYIVDCTNISVEKPQGNWAMDIWLFDSLGEELEQFYNFSTATASFKLKPNETYYLVARTRRNLGNYKFKVTEVVDNAPDTREMAKSLELGEIAKGSFEVNGDEDWFKVKTKAAGKYVITTNNINIAYCRLVVTDEYEQELYSGYRDYNTTSFVLDLEANKEYYFWCYSGRDYTGNYSIAVTSDSIEKAKATLSKDSYTYNGKARKPSVKVTMNQVTLVEGTDYTVSYSKNTKVGNAKVIITGKGNYKGTLTKKFKINKAKISTATVSKISNQAYTGKDIKPSVTVKLAGKKLTKGTDYKVSYSNNKKMGTATITIKAKGSNLTGSKKVTFKIVPKKINLSKAVNSGSKKAKLTWKKDKTVTGYEVYRSTKKKSGYELISTVKSNKKTSYTDSNLKKNKTYYYKVRSYKTVNGKKYYGSYSSVKSVQIKK